MKVLFSPVAFFGDHSSPPFLTGGDNGCFFFRGTRLFIFFVLCPSRSDGAVVSFPVACFDLFFELDV